MIKLELNYNLFINLFLNNFLQDDNPVKYDIIVLSLVLNFVGLPERRGDMLKKCCAICKPQGYLVVSLTIR